MKSRNVSVEEMARRTARFKDLKPYQTTQQQAAGVPSAVLEKIAARMVFPLMVPEGYQGRNAQAPIKGAPGLSLSITESPPGDGAALHMHEQTVENFFCLSGKFKISWGDKGENSLVLEPNDFCSIPPGVVRSFENISAVTGRMLVIIQIQTAEQSDRIAYVPELKDEIAAAHGKSALDALDSIGIRFNAGLEEKA